LDTGSDVEIIGIQGGIVELSTPSVMEKSRSIHTVFIGCPMKCPAFVLGEKAGQVIDSHEGTRDRIMLSEG